MDVGGGLESIGWRRDELRLMASGVVAAIIAATVWGLRAPWAFALARTSGHRGDDWWGQASLLLVMGVAFTVAYAIGSRLSRGRWPRPRIRRPVWGRRSGRPDLPGFVAFFVVVMAPPIGREMLPGLSGAQIMGDAVVIFNGGIDLAIGMVFLLAACAFGLVLGLLVAIPWRARHPLVSGPAAT
jgi:hypothetical protein